MSAPSGRQWTLARGSQSAVVTEVGGTLREYTVDDQPVLDGFAEDRMADGGRGQPLLPWPNRLADGHYAFDGQEQQLPVDEVARHNASHGLTRWGNWTLEEQRSDTVRVEHVIHPRPGYPFVLALQITYSLDDTGLTVHTRAHNRGTTPLPFGAGQHPYFSVGTVLVDTAILQLPARTRLELDPERRLPTGRGEPVQGALDFTSPRAVGSLALDHCFTDLLRGVDGRARATLTNPTTGRRVTVWVDERYRYLQVFSGDTLAVDRQRRGLAIEPMTCPPNAFRTGIDLIVLRPDESVDLEWGVGVDLTAPRARPALDTVFV